MSVYLSRHLTARLWRLWCAVAGCKPYTNNLFSGRMRVCTRCHKLPNAA